MGAAASSHDRQRGTDAGARYRSFEEMVNETFMVSGTAVGSHGEVVGIPVEANQGAQDDAARGSFDYIWRIEGLPSSQEEGNFRSQFEAKGLEWEISLLLASDSRDQRSVSVRLYLRGDAPCGWEDNAAKLRLTYAITLFNQNSCRQDWQRSAINTFADHRDGKWSIKEFIASDAFMDPSNGFVVDGSCTLGVTLLRVHLLRVKKESLLVHHRPVNHEHTWLVRNFITMEHQCMRREEFEAAGCRWSIYLHRIRVEHYSHDDVVLFLSLDSTTAQKKSITASYQFQVRGLASGYEFRNAYTNVFVPGQCHGGELSIPSDGYGKYGWSFEEDTWRVRMRLTVIGYVEAKGNDVRALQLEDP
ncbi:hypothetical protein SETIT_2G420200v2 [Setaria italica]|uniref:MATH domain-containing protein n=1 Tax=Setaria italica TaxID=4555 RepID=A0A368Q8Q7_SETIT|nr:uncharacterized protein LOC101767947 [Setaria italica]RCV14371.1 hypothetical protein SETIT_2G420200v2 [Setaria italica]